MVRTGLVEVPRDHRLDEFPVIFFEVDTTGAIISISEEWTRLTGRPKSEALGHGWKSSSPASELTSLPAVLLELAKRTEASILDFHIVAPSGEKKPMRAWLRPHRRDGGLFFSGVAITIECASLEHTHAARSEAFLSALPDLQLELTLDGTCLKFRGPPGSLGLDTPEGRRLEELLPAAAARSTLEALERARSSGQLQLWELEMSTPAQGSRIYEARLWPMSAVDFVMLLRDVSEARRARAELVAAREAALESSRHTTQFLANFSHEIRTPLSGILSVTQLLRTWSLPKEGNEYLDVLQSAGESLLAIVSDVLDLSKIEANRLDLELTTFDAAQLVTTTARTFFPQANKKGLALDIQVGPMARGRVRGDEKRLRQLVTNLVANAVKFTDEGKVEVSLDRTAPDLPTLRLMVRDSGPGIAAELHEVIFEAFVQAQGAQRRHGGTGLGLSIARRLARLMGGDVRVESTVGEGSTFTATVSMPLVESTERPQPAWRRLAPQRSLGVLLAEDNAVNATMTSALLARLGHQVRVVSDGQAAVEAVSAGTFDVVLMDVQMPVLDGLEATRVIRRAEQTSGRHIPIVALTASAMKGDDLMCLSAGMDAYLPKPVSVEALKDVLTWFAGPG